MSSSSYEGGVGRRDVLCSGGSAVFSSLIAALLGELSRRARRPSQEACRRSTGPLFASSRTTIISPLVQVVRSAMLWLSGSVFRSQISRRKRCF